MEEFVWAMSDSRPLAVPMLSYLSDPESEYVRVARKLQPWLSRPEKTQTSASVFSTRVHLKLSRSSKRLWLN